MESHNTHFEYILFAFVNEFQLKKLQSVYIPGKKENPYDIRIRSTLAGMEMESFGVLHKKGGVQEKLRVWTYRRENK